MSKAADVTDANWETVVLKSKTTVLVDFWAEWCGPCKAMSPYVEKLAVELGDRVKVVKLNTQDNPEVPSRYGINSIPTFLIIKEGVVKETIIGARPYEMFKQAVVAKL